VVEVADPSDQREVVLDWIAGALAGHRLDRPLRVAVDGITAAGKTTFADDLTARIRARGVDALRVSMDGFHQPRAVRYRQGRASPDGYYEDAYDFAALRRELLEPLGPDGDRRYRTRVIDLASDEAVDDPAVRASERAVLVVDGSFLQRPEVADTWDVVVFLATSFAVAEARGVARDTPAFGSSEAATDMYRVRYHAAQHRYLAEVDPERRAEIVVACDDPGTPVVLADRRPNAVRAPDAFAATREFFAPRAAGWNDHFAHDAPRFDHAVAALGVGPGDRVLDAGCGAGRAFAALRAPIGAGGVVVGTDVTSEMVERAATVASDGRVLVADAARTPARARVFDAVFTAGLLEHLPDPFAGLVDLARVVRPGGRLALFHPVGRAALAHKHGRQLDADGPLDPAVLPTLLAATGWSADAIDDGDDGYLAVATRVDVRGSGARPAHTPAAPDPEERP